MFRELRKVSPEKKRLEIITGFLILLTMFSPWTAPEVAAYSYGGFEWNQHDFQRLVGFLEQTDESGVRNGEKISSYYKSQDPATWVGLRWWNVGSTMQLAWVEWENKDLVGTLNLSGCARLEVIHCSGNRLTEINTDGCIDLKALYAYDNGLTKLSVRENHSLRVLYIPGNNLTFASLPILSIERYVAYPQNPIPIGEGGQIGVGDIIDLSAQAWFGGTATVFTWYHGEQQVSPKTASGGIFTFGSEHEGKEIYCRFSNSVFPYADMYRGQTLETSRVTVVPPVNPPLQITQQPQSQAIRDGGRVTFSVESVADDDSHLSYQWHANGRQIPGATGSSYILEAVRPADHGGAYWCTVTRWKNGVVSASATSDQADLYVVHSGDYDRLRAFLEYGEGAEKNGFTVNPDHYSPHNALTWGVTWDETQSPWRVREIDWTGKGLAGALDLSGFSSLKTLHLNSNHLTALNVAECTSLRLLYARGNDLFGLNVSGCGALTFFDCGENRLTLATLPLFTPPSGGFYAYDGQKPMEFGVEAFWVGQVLDMSAHATIDGSDTTFFWFIDCGSYYRSFTPEPGPTKGTFYVGQWQAGELIGCEMTNPAFPGAIFITESIRVYRGLTIHTPPTDQPVVLGNTVEFAVEAETYDHGIISYSWERCTDGSTWAVLAGETTAKLVTPPITEMNLEHQYRCIVRKTGHGPDQEFVSEAVRAYIFYGPIITVQPMDQWVPEGADAVFSVVAVVPDHTPGGVLSYQWQLTRDFGDSWISIPNAVLPSYTVAGVSPQDQFTPYRCTVTNAWNGAEYTTVSTSAIIWISMQVLPFELTFIKPIEANDEFNSVNISSGSMVIMQVDGALEGLYLTLALDDGAEESLVPNSRVYYLLSSELESGEHTIRARLKDENGDILAEKQVTFYFENYRRGFGFGRFDFGDN